MIEDMTQAMACIFNTNKDPTEGIVSTKPSGGKPYLGKKKPPKGLDGLLDPSLMCYYCKDTWHELENCCRLQHRIRREQLAAESIIAEQALNRKYP